MTNPKKRNNFAVKFEYKTTNTIKELTNTIMNDQEKDFFFSEKVKAGKRIYYFDVKKSRNGEKYIAITESKKIMEGDFDNPRISFEKHKIFLYKEDYEKFINALTRSLAVAKGEKSVEEAKTEVAETVMNGAMYHHEEKDVSDDIKLDVEF